MPIRGVKTPTEGKSRLGNDDEERQEVPAEKTDNHSRTSENIASIYLFFSN